MQKKYINEVAWSKIFNFLKQCSGIYIISEKRCKKFVEEVYWLARTGAQWREMNERYGNWNTIFKRFNAWSKKNIWDKLFNFCIQDPDLEYIMIDSIIVRAHACSAGYGKQKIQGLGRSKGGFTSKIHASVDGLGNPLKFIITPGQEHDLLQAKNLLNDLSNAYILADKAYGSYTFREHIRKQQCIDVIPSRINSINPVQYDKYIYKERHAIECFFSKIKHFRRVFSRFDKSARNFKSFLSFVGAFIWLK